MTKNARYIFLLVLTLGILRAGALLGVEPVVRDVAREIDLREAERKAEIQGKKKTRGKPSKLFKWARWIDRKLMELRHNLGHADYPLVPNTVQSNVWVNVGYRQAYEYDSNPFWIGKGRRDAHRLVFEPYAQVRYIGKKSYVENLFAYRSCNYLGTLSGHYNTHNFYDRFLYRYNLREDLSLAFENLFSAGDSVGKLKEQYIFNRSRFSLKHQMTDELAVNISAFGSLFHDTSNLREPIAPGVTKRRHNYSDFNDVGGNITFLYEPRSDLRFMVDQGVYWRNFWDAFSHSYIASRSIVGMQWDYLQTMLTKMDALDPLVTRRDVNLWKITALGGVEARGYQHADNLVEPIVRLSTDTSFFDRKFQIMGRYRHDVDDTVVLPESAPFKAFDCFGDLDSLVSTPAQLLTLNRLYRAARYDDFSLQTAWHVFNRRLTLGNGWGFRFNDYIGNNIEYTAGRDKREDEWYWYARTGLRYRFTDWFSVDGTYTYVFHSAKEYGEDYDDHVFSVGFNFSF